MRNVYLQSRTQAVEAPVAAGLILAALLSGCSAEPAIMESRQIVDLAEGLSAASVQQPTTRIDFGKPSSGPHLVRGWSRVSKELEGPQGATASWSTGDLAEIEFFVTRPTEVEVAFRCVPVGATRESSRELVLEVNGSFWQKVALEPDWSEYRRVLPAALLRSGYNRLRIVHPRLLPASAPGDHLRVLWDYLEFGGPVPRRPAQARAQKGVLFLPFDTRVDYFVELPASSFLQAEQIRSRGSSVGRLVVLWQAEAGEERTLSRDLTAQPSFRLALGQAPARGRLSLLALASDADASDKTAGIILRAPVIVAGGQLAEASRSAREAQRPGLLREPAPNVIIYLVDTLRADHLGCYGYEKNTSPHLDEFAAEAFLFENAQAQSPWTRPSVASIFTGLWPQLHGTNQKDDALPDAAVTLAEIVREHGYQTAAITSNGNAHRANGFAQGFGYFKYLRQVRPGEPLATSADVHQAVSEWLQDFSGQQPFFLFIHTIDPHAPYMPPEPFRSQFASFVEDPDFGALETLRELNRNKESITPLHLAKLEALYDAEIAANDASFGNLLEELERRDLYNGSLIIFLSDHGEEFYDHGDWVHGKTLHAEMLDVPLVIKLPGSRRSGRVREMAQHVDLPATVLDLLGVPLPSGIQGRSLLPLMTDEPSVGWTNRAVAYVDNEGRHSSSLIDGSWKLIQPHDGRYDAFPELYDRERDRSEHRNLAPERPTLARFLAALLKTERASHDRNPMAADVDPEEMGKLADELQALGYLE